MKLTSKGQVTIPQKYRNQFGLHPDTEVVFEEKDGELVIRPRESRKEGFERWLEKSRGSADAGMGTEEIMKQTRGED